MIDFSSLWRLTPGDPESGDCRYPLEALFLPTVRNQMRYRIGNPAFSYVRPIDENGQVGHVERAIRDRAAETLIEIPDLDVRAMFSGFGFYIDGLLVAAAWDGAFRLRHRESGRWRYKAVDDALVDDPRVLIPLVRERAEQLAHDPDARRRR